MKQYQKTWNQVVADLSSDNKVGLSDQQIKERREKFGFNVLPEVAKENWLTLFFQQFKSPLIYILLISAVIIFFVGEDKIDAFIISGVLFFNAIVGTIQAERTRNIIESLKRFVKTKSVVIRNGKEIIVEDKELVPGDIITLQEGQRVPADARVIESIDLKIDEAVLTGESQAVEKFEEALKDETPVADQRNMVFRGTYVVAGAGKAIVTAIADDTQIGKIHRSIEEIKTDIPLKRELNRLSYWILVFISLMCTGLFSFGLIMGRSIDQLLVMLVALFICVIPEGLPVVLTLVLVNGAYRMAKQQVLARNLQGVEGLGRADILVIDKTGTLTRNEMMVSTVITDKQVYSVTGQGYHVEGEIKENGTVIDPQTIKPLDDIARASMLLVRAHLTYNKKLGVFDIVGDPTEAALLVFAKKVLGTQKNIEDEYSPLFTIPFSSERKYQAAFFKQNDKGVAYVIGAPEIILASSGTLDQSVQKQYEALLHKGLRVLALAKKEFDITNVPASEAEKEAYFNSLIKSDLTFLGICGIEDSMRPGIQDIVRRARQAGVHLIMATGDHKETALQVAKKSGIFQEGDQIIEGKEFEKMSDEQATKLLDKVTVFARVTPDAKVRIIQLLHKQGKLVGMTGDGVNDVPSLVAADLGIAMGGIGTEVAKRAADLVLLDDSLSSIIQAISLGRHIFYTLRRVILYFFSTNLAEILIVFFALMTQLPLPLLPGQILWLNFVTDGFLDVGLSLEPQEDCLTEEKRFNNKSRLINWSLAFKALYMAIPMGIASLLMFSWYYDSTGDVPYSRTVGLMTLIMFQWFNAWNCRSEQFSIFHIGLFANRWLIAASAFVLSLQLMFVYAPFMQFIFKTTAITAYDWLLVIGVSSSILVIEEIRKYIVSRVWKVKC